MFVNNLIIHIFRDSGDSCTALQGLNVPKLLFALTQSNYCVFPETVRNNFMNHVPIHLWSSLS